MKTRVLLLAAILSLATVNAKNSNTSTSKIGVTNRYNETVAFFERGIEFHVFLNGDFDFNTHPRENNYYDVDGYRYRNRNGVRIEKDFRGRIRRVGNVFINYDRRGNVTRIGSVYMRYKFGNLSKVGNLKINYDRWGKPYFRGFVKPGRYNHCDDDYYYNGGYSVDIDVNIDIFDYDDVYFYRRDFRDNYRQYKEDDNFYYYRAQPNAKINKKRTYIKRRKTKGVKKIKGYPKKRKRKIVTPKQTSKSKRSR